MTACAKITGSSATNGEMLSACKNYVNKNPEIKPVRVEFICLSMAKKKTFTQVSHCLSSWMSQFFHHRQSMQPHNLDCRLHCSEQEREVPSPATRELLLLLLQYRTPLLLHRASCTDVSQVITQKYYHARPWKQLCFFIISLQKRFSLSFEHYTEKKWEKNLIKNQSQKSESVHFPL